MNAKSQEIAERLADRVADKLHIKRDAVCGETELVNSIYKLAQNPKADLIAIDLMADIVLMEWKLILRERVAKRDAERQAIRDYWTEFRSNIEQTLGE